MLAARIAADGPVSVHDYMEACLYDPEYGYYRRREALGRGGDFITAPEISQVFGELIGLWAGESWRLMGQPGPIRLIELGPGRGTLMVDALRALRVLPAFLNNATIHLVETSQALQAAQEAALASAPCPIAWHETIEEVPAGATIVIANEFVDCLPVRQFVFDEAAETWRERMVAFGEGGFRFELGSNDVASPSPLPLSHPHPPADADIPSGKLAKASLQGRGELPLTLGTDLQQARPTPSPARGEYLPAQRARPTPLPWRERAGVRGLFHPHPKTALY